MSSVVDIANRALDKLGHGAITSFTDGSKAANLLDRTWSIVRNQVLRDHPWNFAVKRAILAPLSDSPSWGFTYQHQLPSDYLRLIEIRDLRAGEYQLEDGKILADSDSLYIRYIYEVTDPNLYDALFIDSLATKVAFELSEALTQSNAKKNLLGEEYTLSIQRAKSIDAVENPPTVFQEDSWLEVRF